MADSILRLKVESQEYDAKIKRAAEGIQRFAEQVYKSGGAVTELEKDEVAFIKALGNMETVSKSATGKLRELEGAYKNLSATYHMLQKDQQNDAGGKALRASLDQLKARIDETRTAIKKADAELNDFSQTEKKFSKESFDLNGILGQVGGQMGINTSLVSGLTTGTLGLGAAITAVAAAEYKAAEAFKAYNDELARQSQITTVTTGLKGDDADNMTAAARSISKVYGTDFREVINAANTLMTQFGTDGEFALKTIRDGMQGMIQGEGPKLLQMIQQYAPAFRDAGISAGQLVAIIQNSEGGIFSAENMNAIVMGIKNLRLMTKATSDALSQLGIDGEKMSKELSDGTISIFDALKQVSNALQEAEAGSQQAGQVMQQVFGRQGTMAGTNLAKAIAELNTNLEETKRQTGEVGESFAALERETEKLEKSMMNLFGVSNWDILINHIKIGFVDALNLATETLNGILNIVDNIGRAFGGPVVQGVVDFLVALNSPIGLIREMYKYLGQGDTTPKTETQEEKAQRMSSSFIGNINSSQDKTGTYTRNIALLNKTLEKYKAEGNKEKADLTQRVIEIVEEHMNDYLSGFGVTKSTVKPTPINQNAPKNEKKTAIENSIGYFQEEIKNWRAEQNDVTSTEAWNELQKKIDETTIKIKELKGELRGDKGVSILDGAAKSARDDNKKIEDRLNDPNVVSNGMTNIVKQISKEQGKEEKKYLVDGFGKLASGLGGIQSGFQQMGIDLGSGFNDVVNGIQGITSILTAIQSIVTAIEIISSVPFFSNGGVVHAAGGFMVPGNNFSGDLVPAYLNSGEMVLNRFQQQALAGTLENGGMKNISISGHLEGETIALSVDRWGKRSGRGELAFWKNQ